MFKLFFEKSIEIPIISYGSVVFFLNDLKYFFLQNNINL